VTGAGASMGRWPVTGQSRSSLQDTGAPPGAEIVRVAARRRLEGCRRRSSLEHTRGRRPRHRACPGGLPPSGPGRLIVDAHRPAHRRCPPCRGGGYRRIGWPCPCPWRRGLQWERAPTRAGAGSRTARGRPPLACTRGSGERTPPQPPRVPEIGGRRRARGGGGGGRSLGGRGPACPRGRNSGSPRLRSEDDGDRKPSSECNIIAQKGRARGPGGSVGSSWRPRGELHLTCRSQKGKEGGNESRGHWDPHQRVQGDCDSP